MALRAELIAVAAILDVDLQRRIERRTVRDVTVGAGNRTGLETTAQRQCLRPVEAIRPAVRPELTLIVIGWNRIAEQERHRVVLVAIAGLESDKDVLLVAVAIRARVEHAPRLGAPGRQGL